MGGRGKVNTPKKGNEKEGTSTNVNHAPGKKNPGCTDHKSRSRGGGNLNQLPKEKVQKPASATNGGVNVEGPRWATNVPDESEEKGEGGGI